MAIDDVVNFEAKVTFPLPDRLQVGDVFLDADSGRKLTVIFASADSYQIREGICHQPIACGADWRARSTLVGGPSYDAELAKLKAAAKRLFQPEPLRVGDIVQITRQGGMVRYKLEVLAVRVAATGSLDRYEYDVRDEEGTYAATLRRRDDDWECVDGPSFEEHFRRYYDAVPLVPSAAVEPKPSLYWGGTIEARTGKFTMHMGARPVSTMVVNIGKITQEEVERVMAMAHPPKRTGDCPDETRAAVELVKHDLLTVRAKSGPPTSPAPRPGQTWRSRMTGKAFTIFDVPGEGDVLCRRDDGLRVTLTTNGIAEPGCEFISGPTEPETAQERRARELRLDLEWDRPADVTPAEYTRRYTGAYEATTASKGITIRPSDDERWRFEQRRLARKAAAKGGR